MKVSVLLTTYNHADYIAEAIQSALDQRTDFDYEILVGEDCSTDETPRIVAELRALNPDRLSVEFNPTNLGMVENYSRTLQRCRGEYLALLEGDDFWTSPHKLQRQVDFLDANPECSVCFHQVEVMDESGGNAPVFRNPPNQRRITTIRDLLTGNYIHTCSVMYRNRRLQALPDWFEGLSMVDWPLHLLHAERGHIGYLPESMGAYRVHGGGIFSAQTGIRQHEAALEVYDRLAHRWGSRYRREIAAGSFGFHYALAIAHNLEGSSQLAWEHARRCWTSAPWHARLARKAKLAGRLFFPRIYQNLERVLNTFRDRRSLSNQ